MSERTLKDLQQEVDTYISQFKEGYFSPLSMLARMSEEVGELAREVNHSYGEKPKKVQKRTIQSNWSLVIFYSLRSALRIHLALI